jgi:hypothetical protein
VLALFSRQVLCTRARTFVRSIGDLAEEAARHAASEAAEIGRLTSKSADVLGAMREIANAQRSLKKSAKATVPRRPGSAQKRL